MSPGRRTLFAYGLPGLPLAVLMLPIFVHLPVFYARDLGLGLATVGVVLLVGRLWDMITDPLVGLVSDRTPYRFGRRKFWMVLGVPLVLISAVFLFQPSAGVSWHYLLGWSFAIYLGGTMILVPYQAWGAELSGDYHQRSRITAWREVMTVLGVLMATGLPALFVTTTDEILGVLTLLILGLLPLAVLAAVVLVPDGEPSGQSHPRPKGQWRVILGNAPFRRLIVAYLLNGLANGLPATLFLLYVEFVLQLPDRSGLFLFTYFVCGILAVPLWLTLSRKVGKHRAWMAAMILSSVTFAIVPLLGPGEMAPFLIICIVTGACLGADLVLPPSMQADVIDLDRLESGQERAGTFFAFWGIATKLALALAVGFAFPTLELVGFSTTPSSGATTAANDAQSLFILAALYSLVPVVFKLAAIAVIRGYPITAARQRDIRSAIETRRGFVGKTEVGAIG